MIVRDRILDARVDRTLHQEALERILELSRSERTTRVLFANVHMLVESRRDVRLREAMERADLVCPDGMPVVRLLALGRGGVQRTEGMSVFPELLALAETEGVAVALYGSAQGILDAISDKIRHDHPRLSLVLALEAPFGEPAGEVDPAHLERLRRSGARLVFTALGCPRQELWMDRAQGLSACLLGVGNAFEVHLGRRRRAPGWAQALCLEWLFRLVQEPRRLGPRYLRTNVPFLLALPGAILARFRPSRNF